AQHRQGIAWLLKGRFRAASNSLKIMRLVLLALLALVVSFTAPVQASSIGCTTSALISAINSASSGSTIDLATNCTYTLTSAFASSVGLPPVSITLTINGHNAVIQRSSAAGTPNFRLFNVNGSGNLTLSNLILKGGNAAGGGAILNQAALSLSSVFI